MVPVDKMVVEIVDLVDVGVVVLEVMVLVVMTMIMGVVEWVAG